jgi:hypothetical protein
LGVEAGEDLEGGGEVTGGEGVVGLLDGSGERGGLGVRVGEILRRESGGADEGEGDGEEKSCGGIGWG